MNRLACPHCLSPDHLGENVVGWRGVKSAALVDGKLTVQIDPATYGPYDVERESFFCSNDHDGKDGRGCNVDHEIRGHDLVQIGDDGQPVVPQIEGQESLL